MTNIERVLQYVQRHPGLDDDELSERTGISPRQQINQICRRLEDSGQIARRVGPSGKICNYSVDEDFTMKGKPASRTSDRFETLVATALKAIKGWDLTKTALPIGERKRSFDFASPDVTIVGDAKSGTGYTRGGNRASAKITDAVATAQALDQLSGPHIRFLAFKDRDLADFVTKDLRRYNRNNPILLITIDDQGQIVKEELLT